MKDALAKNWTPRPARRGRGVSKVSATVPGMTSSTPTPALPSVIPTRQGDRPPIVGVLGVADSFREYAKAAAVDVWYLAVCHRCGDDLAQPFRDEHARDTWASRHVTVAGHTVQLTVDGFDKLPGLHMTAVLRRDDDDTFRWLCPAGDCERWSPRFVSAQLAVAAWRTHSGIAR